MNKSKIIVPTTSDGLAEPRFDDVATIVSARRVVPIAQARAADRRRKALFVSLILLGAAACGGGGAIVVNHYLQSRPPMAVQAPPAQTEQPAENSPALIQTRSSAPATNSQEPVTTGHVGDGGQGTVARAVNTGETTKPAESATPDAANNSSAPSPQSSPSPSLTTATDSGNVADPGTLTRKRRVHPVNPTADMIRTKAEEKVHRGSALIQQVLDRIGHP